jgi:ABC-type branched-subunit amino acid transport system ATPase component/branched-subunit amino acid ABC-type transport system permease component
MMEIIRFALLGLATGAIYALLSQGLVLIYRGSGLLNFAQGAMAMFGAFAYYQMTVRFGLPEAVSIPVALALCAALGALVQLGILRTMRRASALSRVIATLGIVLVLQSAAFLIYGQNPLQVPSVLPSSTVHLFSNSLAIGQDRIWIFGICLVLSVGLYLLYRLTPFGRVTTAVAENELAAAAFGLSPDVVAAANWAIGSALAGLAGILIAPILYLEPTSLVLLVIPAMAAALIGGFSSFPVTLATALALGVTQSEIERYVSQPGWATAAPFLAVIGVLIVRGRGLPLRSFVLDRLPTVGTGRVRPLVVLVLWGLAAWFAMTSSADWSTALVTTFGSAIVCLSVVLLTGYAGQLSLAQFVLAGIGALVAAKFAVHLQFVPSLVIGTLITVLVGGLVGLPALRTRGITLAVATLCLGAALVAVVLLNPSYTGGVGGIFVKSPTLFGWSLDPFAHPDRYALVTITVFALLGLMVANIRRGVTGRRLLAVRSNERAAASLGVHVAWVKSYAFMVASGIAATGGILLAFIQPSVQVSGFDVFTCVLIVAATVTGGVGYVPGALLGSLIISGGVVSKIFHSWSSVNEYLPLIGGVLLVLTLMFGANGLFELNRELAAKALAPLLARLPLARLPLGRVPRLRRRRAAQADLPPASISKVKPRTLAVRDISVSFGGVHAVREVSLDVRPGEVHGLIGPNGAGKTTLIDAITGFVRASGAVRLADADISGWPARRRASAGLSRSFQSLELFTDLTIRENLAVAGESGDGLRYLTDLVHPGPIRLTDAALEALRQFELEGLIDQRPSEVSFGRRKTVAIARAIASAPSVLLLDEPAAGLDDHEADELAGLIRGLADSWGIAVLLVEHKVDLIMSISDRVTVLDNGRVLASGTPAEITSNSAVIDAYLGSPIAAAPTGA